MSDKSKQEHSPGDWKVVLTSTKDLGVRTKAGFICFLREVSRWQGQDKRYEEELAENRANAALIAAAPVTAASERRLLAACNTAWKALIGERDSDTQHREAISQLEAAIKQATP